MDTNNFRKFMKWLSILSQKESRVYVATQPNSVFTCLKLRIGQREIIKLFITY